MTNNFSFNDFVENVVKPHVRKATTDAENSDSRHQFVADAKKVLKELIENTPLDELTKDELFENYSTRLENDTLPK
jgi:hypothetical protein